MKQKIKCILLISLVLNFCLYSFSGIKQAIRTPMQEYPVPKLLWKLKTDYPISASPIIVEDILYFGNWNGKVYALNINTGFIKWVFNALHSVDKYQPIWYGKRWFKGVIYKPAIFKNNIYFICCFNNKEYIFSVNSKTGLENWRYAVGDVRGIGPGLDSKYSLALLKELLIFGSESQGIIAVNPKNGKKQWNFPLEIYALLPFPNTSNGIIYFGGNILSLKKYFFIALDSSDLKPKWKYRFTSAILTKPIISDGIAYFGTDDGFLHAIKTDTGEKVWEFKAEFGIRSIPVISYGTIYFGSFDKNLYALDSKTGKEIWKFTSSSHIVSSPLVNGNIIYISTYYDGIYAYDMSTSKVKWRYLPGGYLDSSPVYANGVVYFGCQDGYLYALRE